MSQLGYQKLCQGLVSHELTAYLSNFYPFFDSMKLPYYQKQLNQITLNYLIIGYKNHIIGLLITQRNMTFFLIPSKVLGLLDQLQLYLIQLTGLLRGLALLKLQHLIHPRLWTGFGMLVFLTNVKIIEFKVRYLALFLFFSVIDGLHWFWMGSLHKNNQLILEFLKALFLVLHSSYYTLMTFLMMLSMTMRSRLMTLLSFLKMIRYLICGNNQNWLLNVNLIYETLWSTAGSGLLISMQEKLNWFYLNGNNTGATNVKIDGSVLEER